MRGADPERVHQRDLCPRPGTRGELRVGDQVAQRPAIAALVALRPHRGAADPPRRARDELAASGGVSGDIGGDVGTRGEAGKLVGGFDRTPRRRVALALDDHVARVPGHDFAADRVDRQADVGDQLAEHPRAGQQERAGRIALRIVADVGPVGVARGDHVDARVEPVEDRQDRPAQRLATLRVRRAGGPPALVDQHHDRVRALRLERGDARVDRVGLVGESDPANPVGRDQAGGRGQRRPDQPDRNLAPPLAEAAQRGSRKQRRPVGAQCVGGEERELRTAERLDLAGLARGVLDAPARLLAQQLVGPRIELVIAHRVEIEADAVHRLDRRFVEIERRDQRRSADHVARRDGQMVRILGADRVDRAGQICRPARRDRDDRPIGQRRRDRLLRHLQRAVEIVDRDDPDLDRRATPAPCHRCRAASHGQGKQRNEAEQRCHDGATLGETGFSGVTSASWPGAKGSPPVH